MAVIINLRTKFSEQKYFKMRRCYIENLMHNVSNFETQSLSLRLGEARYHISKKFLRETVVFWIVEEKRSLKTFLKVREIYA